MTSITDKKIDATLFLDNRLCQNLQKWGIIVLELVKNLKFFCMALVVWQSIVAMPALAGDFNATTYPIAVEPIEHLAMLIAKGTREKDGKRLIMTAHLSFPLKRTRLLAIKVEENSANTKITGEKNLATGETKIFLSVQDVFIGPPKPVMMLIFDGETSSQLPMIEISRYQRTVSGSFQRNCNRFTGCILVRTPDYLQQFYTWSIELPIAGLRSFVERSSKPDDRLVFWVGTKLEKAAKSARKISDGNYLLFRNQAKAVLDALEIAPR